MSSSTQKSVLVVCLGNICRSPMGQAVLTHVAKERGIDIHVESAGTAGYHVGDEPDERTVATCQRHGVKINSLAQQVERSHFKRFDYILASDRSNLSTLERVKPADSTAIVCLFSNWSDGLPIQDPYYGGMDGFEKCFTQCEKYSNALLDHITSSGEGSKSAL
ncbi:hypothetical protein FRB91_007727 [Serendipita sp. 411]|nr:hypothetical protein FRB91_007727 [Serendipita sp. 411]